MAPEHHDWTRHGAGRSLLWWPLSSFVLMAVFPDAGILPIVLSGLALALVGVTGTVAARMLRRRLRARRAEGVPAALTAAVGDVVDEAVEKVESVIDPAAEPVAQRRAA
ncbi:hypothetical protein GCM10010472_06760 [Pseudonocardia halophobica]|uniref:Uncharacterized protein n=1 Tax=Pseudonocardia halophobica TaxID=29401 RepID=A0A9W6KY24_9PSEU|nr:hypothetical protein [Pseudonocardia halophobica]GLL10187.1 hypothetical protein GCM10017577_13270 [Pseudonocardia halophobica]